MTRTIRQRRFAAWLSLALTLGLLSLTACGVTSAQTHMLTAADILQNATSALNLNGTSGTAPTSGTAVKDLTFTMKFNMDMNATTGATSTTGAQKISETMSATGKETLAPRRTQMDATMAIMGQNITMTIIADYATTTGYLKMAGLAGLPGAASGKWYKMSYGSLSGLGADTSMYTDYSKLKDATLVGSETLDGVAVWHLRAKEDINQAMSGLGGSSATGASASGGLAMNATLDYYFRQDNYRPVKIGMAATETLSGLGTFAITGEMDFTSFNTGVMIKLPPPSEVQSLGL